MRRILPVLILFFAGVLFAQTPLTIRVDAGRQIGPFPSAWAYFGYDEPNYTYAEHGRELIQELADLSRVPVRIRTHNLLTTGDGVPSPKWGSTNAYTEDAAGHPVYDWTILDRIFDTYEHAGAKPFVEIGFMPEALSTHPQPYRHNWPEGKLFTGWAYPPTDYKKWAELVHQWVLHCVARYGRREVETWDWEVWNEPNIGYWQGTPEEYDKLYDFTADAVKRALPAARVGGPATTGPSWAPAATFLKQFLDHCAHGTNAATGKTGAPLDFISFHDKGAPKIVDGHLQMGLANNLRDVQQGFEIIASYPEFAKLPVILSESDPEGCAACTLQKYPQAAYRNGALYAAYTAAALRGILELAKEHNTNLAGILTWAFEFEDQPYFAGLRTLATHGIDKPILNLFRMLGTMQGERVPAVSSGEVNAAQIMQSGVRASPDVDALAARSDRSLSILLWNYHDDDLPAAATPVKLEISGLPPAAGRVLVRQYRIDEDHSNAYTLWKAMGSPQNPTPEQYARLKAAGQLQSINSPRWASASGGNLPLDLSLPRQSVSLMEVTW